MKTLQPAAIGISSVFWAIATVTIFLRIWSRVFIIKSFGLDDVVMTTILFFNTGQQAMFLFFVHYGGGKHIAKVNPENFVILEKGLFAEEILYIWMHFVIKMSFLLFYLRITHTATFTRLVYGAIGVVVTFTVACWLIYCLQCIPLQAFWDAAAYPGAKCLTSKITYYVPVSLCIIGDFIILILPIQPLWNMQATLRRRITLIGVITFGGMSPVVSLLRIIVLHEFEASPDFTWVLGKMVIVSAIELNVAIMASNAASLKAIWAKYVTKTLTSSMDPQGSYPPKSKNSNVVSNELSDLPYGSRPKRSHHTRVTSIDGDATIAHGEEWNNGSEEELFHDNAIKVTSSVDMISKRGGSTSSTEINRPYFDFSKK